MKKSIIKIVLSLSFFTLPLTAFGVGFLNSSISSNISKQEANNNDPYKATYLNDDGSILYETNFKKGETPKYLGPLPKKESDDAFIYSFATWIDESNGNSTNLTYRASYYQFNKTYKVTWLDYDDSILEIDYVKSLTLPEYNGEIPETFIINGNECSFSYWSGEGLNELIKSDLVFKATYTKILIKHKVRFVSDTGEVYDVKEYKHGEVPSYNGKTPSKSSEAGYDYKFIGWDKEFTRLLEDTTYVARFEKVPHKFKVTWKNIDGTILSEEQYDYHEIPTYKGNLPTYSIDDGYFYDFIGWDKGLNPITQDITYVARYKRNENKYLIKFYHNEILLYATYVKQGEIPTYEGKSILTYKDDYYDYAFVSWDKPVVAAFADASYYAQYEIINVHEFDVSFVDQNNEVLHTSKVKYNNLAAYPSDLETPKYKTSEGTYSFARWEPNISLPIKGNTIFKPVFTLLDKTYTITFYNYDDTIFDVIEVSRNSLLTYDRIPIKPGTTSTHFEFVGWDNEFGIVQSDLSFHPIFEEKINEYEIRFVNDNGALINKEVVEHGKYPTLDTVIPTSTYNPTYNFAGWSPRINAATEDITYRAIYTYYEVYDVRFVDYDGSFIRTIPIAIGGYSYYYGENPIRSDDEYNSYEFKGWDQSFKYIYKDETYVARYTPSSGKFHLTFLNADDSILYEYNETMGVYPLYPFPSPTYEGDSNYNYYFNGWDKQFDYVYENQTYKATYEKRKIITHIYKNYDDTILYQETLEEGNPSSYQGDTPTKPDGDNIKYIFVGFNLESESDFEKVYRAHFAEDKYYNIVFKDSNGEILETAKVKAGVTPNIPEVQSIRDDYEARIRYEFIGWDTEVVPATNDKTYTAQYNEIKLNKAVFSGDNYNQEVYFVEGESPLDKLTVFPEPIIDHVNERVQEFSDFSFVESTPEGDSIYVANYIDVNYRNVVDYMWDEGIIGFSEIVTYGSDSTYIGDTPKKAMDFEQTPFVFDKWDQETTNIRSFLVVNALYKTYGLKISNYSRFTFDEYGYSYTSTNKTSSSRGYVTFEILEDKTFTFSYQTSTEQSYDKLVITYYDSTNSRRTLVYSGNSSGTYSLTLRKGTTLTLEYTKDSSVDRGSDEVNVTFLN